MKQAGGEIPIPVICGLKATYSIDLGGSGTVRGLLCFAACWALRVTSGSARPISSILPCSVAVLPVQPGCPVDMGPSSWR
jgi:hypothetical protein